jgi:hypothetical protein
MGIVTEIPAQGAPEPIPIARWTIVLRADSYPRSVIIPGAMKFNRVARQGLLKSFWRCFALSYSPQRPPASGLQVEPTPASIFTAAQ